LKAWSRGQVADWRASKHAVKLYHPDTAGNRFANLTINITGLAAFNITNATDTQVINNTFIGTPWDYYTYNSTITEYVLAGDSLEMENGHGVLKFLNTSLTASGSNLSAVIQIGNNSVFVNSTLDPGRAFGVF